MLSKALGLFHSEHCKGIHLNMLTAPPRPYNPWHMLQAANAMLPYVDRFPVFATAEEISWLKDTFHFQKEETGKLQHILCLWCNQAVPDLCDMSTSMACPFSTTSWCFLSES